MIALVAVLKIKEGMEEKVAYAVLKMAEAVSRHEKDCLFYEPYMPVEGTGEVYILEKYTTAEALELHRQTTHYLEFRDTVKDALKEAPQVKVLKPVG